VQEQPQPLQMNRGQTVYMMHTTSTQTPTDHHAHACAAARHRLLLLAVKLSGLWRQLLLVKTVFTEESRPDLDTSIDNGKQQQCNAATFNICD
jgi:hypothetical protein